MAREGFPKSANPHFQVCPGLSGRRSQEDLEVFVRRKTIIELIYRKELVTYCLKIGFDYYRPTSRAVSVFRKKTKAVCGFEGTKYGGFRNMQPHQEKVSHS